MREWFVKPLLIVLAIVVVLAAISLLWLRAGPTPARAADKAQTPYHQRLEQAMRDLEDS